MTESTQKHKSLISAAISLNKAGENDRAIDVLNAAIELRNDHIPSYVLLGSLYQEENQTELAEAAYRKAYSLDPDDQEAIKGIGLFLFEQKRYIEALPYLQKQFDHDPSDPDIAFQLASALLEIPEREGEEIEVLMASWDKTHDFNIAYFLGRRYFEKEEPVLAEKLFEEVLSYSRTPKTLIDVANSYRFYATDSQNKDYYTKAIHFLLEASSLEPNNDEIWRSLSHIYLGLGYLDKALEAAEYAISFDPQNFKNLIAKNQIYYETENFSAAFELSMQIVELILVSELPDYIKRIYITNELINRFVVTDELDRPEEASKILAEGRSLLPNESIFYSLSVQHLFRSGKYQEALNFIGSVEDTKIMQRLLTWKIALLHVLGRTNESRRLTLELSEDEYDDLSGKAIKLYISGQRSGSISLFRDLSLIKPDEEEYSINLAYALTGEGELSEAEDLLIQMLDVSDDIPNMLLAMCDLAYLYNITQRFEEALTLVNKYKKDISGEQTAILRVSFYINKKMYPDHLHFPGRDINIYDAAYACAISSSLAMSNINYAQDLFDEYEENRESDVLFYMVKGCLRLANGDIAGARESWGDALEYAESELDSEKINEWLNNLESA